MERMFTWGGRSLGYKGGGLRHRTGVLLWKSVFPQSLRPVGEPEGGESVAMDGGAPLRGMGDTDVLGRQFLGLGLAACQRGMSVGFTTAAALVHELMEARDDRRLLNLQRQLARLRLLIIDELGFVPLSKSASPLHSRTAG